MEIRLRMPNPRPWFLGLLAALAILGTFMALDRLTLHWYVPKTQTLQESVDRMDSRLLSTESRLSGIDSELNRISQVVQQKASASTGDLQQWEAIGRLSQAVTINSLVQNYGGWQTTVSPQGKACVAYLIIGQGSISDCGFQHVE